MSDENGIKVWDPVDKSLSAVQSASNSSLLFFSSLQFSFLLLSSLFLSSHLLSSLVLSSPLLSSLTLSFPLFSSLSSLVLSSPLLSSLVLYLLFLSTSCCCSPFCMLTLTFCLLVPCCWAGERRMKRKKRGLSFYLSTALKQT